MFLTKNVLEAGALRYIPLKQNATQRNNNRNPGGQRYAIHSFCNI